MNRELLPISLPKIATDYKTRVLFAATLRAGGVYSPPDSNMLARSTRTAKIGLETAITPKTQLKISEPLKEAKRLVLKQATKKARNYEDSSSKSIYSVSENDTDYLQITNIFLRDIWKFPRLTYKQEVSLALTREKGLEAQLQLETSQLSAEDMKQELPGKVEKGKNAELDLIHGNQRLVVYIARKFIGRGLPIDDLIQEGEEGLRFSLQSFDWRRGNKLSSYIYYGIWRFMQKAIRDQSRTIRISSHASELLIKIRKTSNDLDIKLGREATSFEIAQKLGISPGELLEFQKSTSQPISIETNIFNSDDDALTQADMIGDPSVNIPAAAEQKDLRRILEDKLLGLAPIKTGIVKRFVGWDYGGRPQTDAKIAREMGISDRNRVTKLRAQAIAELRTPALRLQVAEYLE